MNTIQGNNVVQIPGANLESKFPTFTRIKEYLLEIENGFGEENYEFSGTIDDKNSSLALSIRQGDNEFVQIKNRLKCDDIGGETIVYASNKLLLQKLMIEVKKFQSNFFLTQKYKYLYNLEGICNHLIENHKEYDRDDYLFRCIKDKGMFYKKITELFTYTEPITGARGSFGRLRDSQYNLEKGMLIGREDKPEGVLPVEYFYDGFEATSVSAAYEGFNSSDFSEIRGNFRSPANLIVNLDEAKEEGPKHFLSKSPLLE